MAEYTLYCFAQSGNAYKPALALELAGADWAPRFVDYFGGETRSPAYRAINVMGEVPVLEHRGTRLSQSGVILDYLAETLDRFGAADDAERREILRWLLFDNHKLTSYTATYRFMRTFVKEPDAAVTGGIPATRGVRMGRSRRASRRPPLRRRRSDHDRRHLAVRVPVLRRRDRRRLERVSFDSRLARAHPERAALEAPLRPDAGASAALRQLGPKVRARE